MSRPWATRIRAATEPRGVRDTTPDALVFATRTGTPIAPANILRRHVFPACNSLGLRRATWLTFRRTYSSWSHDTGVPANVVSQLMGHANVDTTINSTRRCWTERCVMPSSRVGGTLFTLVHKPEEMESGSTAKLIEKNGAP
jgi:integrase